MADRRGHAADLAVAAFSERYLEPRGGNVAPRADRRLAGPQPIGLLDEPRACRRGHAVAQLYAAAQPSQRFLVRHALDLGEVGLLHLVTRVGDALVERAVVGEEQQAFAVVV